MGEYSRTVKKKREEERSTYDVKKKREEERSTYDVKLTLYTSLFMLKGGYSVSIEGVYDLTRTVFLETSSEKAIVPNMILMSVRDGDCFDVKTVTGTTTVTYSISISVKNYEELEYTNVGE